VKRGLSGVGFRVLGMDVITDLDAAQVAVGEACSVVEALGQAEFCRLSGGELLDAAVAVERLGRLVFAVQVQLAGELEAQQVAADHGCVSTGALLRQVLVISAGDARNRVETARVVVPGDSISGGQVPPVLPLLGQAVAAGLIGVEQTRTVVASMKQLSPKVDEEMRGLCEKHLVDNGVVTEPKPFADFARAVVEVCTPDVEPTEDRSGRIELFLGVRNPGTGMTKFHGQLDDLGVEVVSQAIDALSKPRPAASPVDPAAGAAATDPAGPGSAGSGAQETGGPGAGAGGGGGGGVAPEAGGADGPENGAGVDGGVGGGSAAGEPVPDPRSAACRRGQALVEALRRFLDQGTAPIRGGQRPHVTVTIGLDELRRGIGAGCLDFGGPIDAGTLRMLACEAAIIPAVLGTPSQVLDVGRANRLFPPGIRTAIELRDKGCAFPGCDRPPGWTEAHHLRHWVNDGPSSLENGCLLCSRHHSEIHRGHWEVRMAADGLPEFLPPEWIDKERKPRRNNSHHIRVLLMK
jgi:hypothetical protein